MKLARKIYANCSLLPQKNSPQKNKKKVKKKVAITQQLG
tara:strand:+ start:266 stop:382 length:117 start_codon:yes stop_codon:yes gene_type:complete